MEFLEPKNPLGRPPKYTPEELWAKFEEYKQWCKDNPIEVVSKTEYANGNFAKASEYKPRYVSIGGFLIFIGCTETWWSKIETGKKGPEFFKVKATIKKYCEQYQKEMAASGLMKENIISRLLGLADKKEVDGKVDFRFKFGDE